MKLFNKKPTIIIERIDNLRVDGYHPYHYEKLFEKMMYYEKIMNKKKTNTKNSNQKRDSKFCKVLDIFGKIVSIIAMGGILVFVILLILRISEIGQVNIGNLLSIFTFTLFGGIISIGGVKLFSLSANFNKIKSDLSNKFEYFGGCPFVYVIDDEAKQKYDIESPFKIGERDFCNRCKLVDLNGRTVCKINPHYNSTSEN